MNAPWEEEWGEHMGVNTCGVKRADGATIAVRVPDYPTAKLMGAAPALVRALKKALHVGRRRNSTVVEFHTPACWDGIFAYLMKDGHGHKDCAEMHDALAKAGVPLP